MPQQIWLPVPGYESYYEVSNLGNVRSIERSVEWKNRYGWVSKFSLKSVLLKKTKQVGTKTNYQMVSFSVQGKVKRYLVSRLVLCAFKGLDLSRPDLFACHIDDNGENNVLENLFIGTVADNVHDAMRKGRLNNAGEKNGMAKLTPEKVRKIKYMLSNGETGKSISRKFGISFVTVSNIKTGARWPHI